VLTPEGKVTKVSKKGVGIIRMKAPARDHTEIYDAKFRPSLKVPIAMGYMWRLEIIRMERMLC